MSTTLKDLKERSGSESSESDHESRPLNPTLDPSYEPKILRKNNSISRAESSGSLVDESKVLVLYTGGTIGMMRSFKGGIAFSFLKSSKFFKILK